MGKNLIIKGADFSANAIEHITPPQPTTVLLLGVQDFGLFNTLTVDTNGLSHYVYAFDDSVSDSGVITNVRIKSETNPSNSNALFKVYIFGSDKSLRSTVSVDLTTCVFDSQTHIATFPLNIAISAGEYIGYFYYGSNLPKLYNPSSPTTDAQRWTQNYKDTENGVISAYPTDGSQTRVQSISFTQVVPAS